MTARRVVVCFGCSGEHHHRLGLRFGEMHGRLLQPVGERRHLDDRHDLARDGRQEVRIARSERAHGLTSHGQHADDVALPVHRDDQC